MISTDQQIRPLPSPLAKTKGVVHAISKVRVRTVLRFARRHWKKILVIAIIVLPILALFAWIFVPEKPEYITAIAERGTLTQTVEAVGEATSERDVTLKFPVTGVVGGVLAEEGDTVSIGDELAHLRNDALTADVQAASAQLAEVSADLRELKEGTRPEDLRIAEIEVENARASLNSAKASLSGAEVKLSTAEVKLEKLLKEAEVSLAGYVTTSQSTASQQLTIARTSLKIFDDVFGSNEVERVTGQNRPAQYGILIRQKQTAEQVVGDAKSRVTLGFDDYREATASLNQVRGSIVTVSNILDEAYMFIANLDLVGGTFDHSDRETHKATLTTAKKNVQSALSALDTAAKNLQDAAANFDTKIATEENTVASAKSTKETALADIQYYETQLHTKEVELERDRAGARQTDLDAAAAKVNQAYANLNRAKAKLEDTILRAPFDGIITRVDMKTGEFTGDFDNFDYSISMLGASPYRVEMYVAEIDIPKVQTEQTAAIELDAFPDQKFPLHVSKIDPGATEKDGVSKYLVTLDFLNLDANLRIGMSGDAEIYTDRREDVVTIPGRAVLKEEGKEFVRILTDNGEIEERTVITGIDGADGEVEIVEGVEEGEVIIILIKN